MLEIFDLEHEVRHLIDYFPRGTADTAWIHAIAQWDPRPIVLAGDGRILRNKAEAAVLRDANLSFVFLAGGWSNLPWETQAWKLLRVWPDIVRNVLRARMPTIFEVAVGTGKIRRISDTKSL